VAYMNFERLVSDPIAVAPSLSTTGHRQFDRIRVAIGDDFTVSLEAHEAEELADALVSCLAILEDLQQQRERAGAADEGGGR
jgi:hypothetical protein